MEPFTLIEVGLAAVPIVTKLKTGQISQVQAITELCDLAAAKGITLQDVASLLHKFGPELAALLPKSA